MKYFTINEMCKSDTASRKGIENKPTRAVEFALEQLIENVLDKVRAEYGKPIIITSGYRCEVLNKALGGVATSQHVKGEAADMVCEDKKRLFECCIKVGGFDQLIWENGGAWVHISYKAKGPNRGDVLEYSGGRYRDIQSSWQNVINEKVTICQKK